MSLTITLSGPKTSEQQARNALVAEQFDVHPDGHDYGLPPLSDPATQAEAFVCCTGDDVDNAWDAVRPLGWSLRLHHATPEPARPGPEQQLADTFAEYGRRLAALEAASALPPIRGAAVESPPFAEQAGSYPAEQTRRAIGALLQRGANIGTPVGGLVAAGDMLLTAPGSGMSVNVAPGEAYVAGTSSATQGAYYCRVSSITNLAIAASDPSNPRVDRGALVVTDAAYIGSTNTFAVAVVTGTPTAGATLANLTGVGAAPVSSLTDGYVLVPATSTNIVSGDIANVAGVVAPGMVTALVTALPGSPYDGQIINLLVDAADGIVWRFRYRAASVSTYKWEFVGGPPLYSEVQVDEQGNSGTYAALTTAGPSVTLPTLPTGGDFDVTIGCYVETNGSPTGSAYMSFDIGATGAVDVDAIRGYINTSGAGNDVIASISRNRRKTGLASATALVAKYKTVNASNPHYGERFMSVLPVRVG